MCSNYRLLLAASGFREGSSPRGSKRALETILAQFCSIGAAIITYTILGGYLVILIV